MRIDDLFIATVAWKFKKIIAFMGIVVILSKYLEANADAINHKRERIVRSFQLQEREISLGE